jgi:peptidoglycan-N-acetylglucosamine deacetylase
MFDMRLISILGLLTVVVLIGLILDYLRLVRRPVRLGIGLAMLGIITGFYFTLQAVLSGDHFYGPVFTEVKTNQKGCGVNIR